MNKNNILLIGAYYYLIKNTVLLITYVISLSKEFMLACIDFLIKQYLKMILHSEQTEYRTIICN